MPSLPKMKIAFVGHTDPFGLVSTTTFDQRA